MNKKTLILITGLATLLLGLFALPTFAQSPVSAEVDRTSLSTDEYLTLSISIDASAGDASAPALPALAGFEILSSSSGRQVSIVNGDMSVATTYQYMLHPLQPGTLLIEPIQVQINGQVYQTGPIAIDVTQGTGQVQPAQPGLGGLPGLLSQLPGFGQLPGNPGSSLPQADPSAAPADLSGQPFFVESAVDNPTPYQGEQVVYSFRFYQAQNLMEQPSYEPPAFTGFWSDQEAEQQEYQVEVDGQPYRVTELTTTIFPTVVDSLTIEPAKLVIPGGFFSRGGTLGTDSIAVDVRPLPADAPATFTGAVGQFAIQSGVDKTMTEVNDTVTLTVELSGEGNIPTAPDPIWTEGSEWRAFDSEATVQTQFADGVLRGTKTYERVLVPTAGGDLILPAIEYTYFNPATESYETVATEPIIVSVAGEAAPMVPTMDANSAVTTAPVELALRPMKPATDHWASSAALPQQFGYWLLWLLPLALIAGSVGLSQYQQHRVASAETRRSSSAAKKAHTALKGATDSESGQILLTYIAEKLNRSVTGLTQTRLSDLLSTHGVDTAVTARVQNALMHSEMGRYAPGGQPLASDDLLTETHLIIDALEEQMEG